MLTLKPVKSEYYDYLCRSCMNLGYGVKLSERDCVFDERRTCPSCRHFKRLVMGLHLGGHMKMLLK